MRRCFLHVGTHKTGTTSLQQLLTANRDRLQDLGYLYPRSGRPAIAPRGHHNIAWQISNDRRFRKEAGSIADLVAELRGSRGDILLSSEDFECSLHDSDAFSFFLEQLTQEGLSVHLVVYLRNQIEYAESLYLTLIRLGSSVRFGDYLETIIEQGKFRWQESVFSFDYDDLLSRLRGGGVAEVSVRSYDAAKEAGLVDDFLAILGLRSSDLDHLDSDRLNQRHATPAAVQAFYRSCLGRPLQAHEQAAVTAVFGSADPRLGMSGASRRRLIERFAEADRRICLAHGLAEFAAMRDPVATPAASSAIPMEEIFSADLRGALDQAVGAAAANLEA